MIITNLGEFIRKHRILSGYKSRRSLAESTSVSTATISRIERNIQAPEKRTLKDLSKELTTTTYEELLVVAGYKKQTLKELDSTLELSSLDIGLYLDNQKLSPRELAGVISYLRSYRELNKE